jgi:hypothetical protein
LEDTEYPIDGLTVLGIQKKESNELIWEKPITSNMTIDEIYAFLNAFSLLKE